MSPSAVDLTSVPSRLRELVEEAARTGEVVLTESGKAVARIVPIHHGRAARRPGSARGVILHMADDFDATPDDFKDYI